MAVIQTPGIDYIYVVWSIQKNRRASVIVHMASLFVMI